MSNNIIAIIDYNMGNLRSVQKAFEKIGSTATITNNPKIIQNASKIVLPGVGSFSDGMNNLKKLGLVELLNQEIVQKKKYCLGICLGMQLLATKGYENVETTGLGWIEGEVKKFDFSDTHKSLNVPHVGWNNVCYKSSDKLFKNISDKSDFYFVHSFYFQTKEQYARSYTNYGIEFVASVNNENIFGVQFHPEKSQKVGLQLLDNFVKLN